MRVPRTSPRTIVVWTGPELICFLELGNQPIIAKRHNHVGGSGRMPLLAPSKDGRPGDPSGPRDYVGAFRSAVRLETASDIRVVLG